jgi:hypothetical protein
VGDDDALRGEPVPVGVEVGEAQVVRDVLVPVVALNDEQVGIRGGVDDRAGPGGVAGVGDRLAGQVQAEDKGGGSAGVIGLLCAGRRAAHSGRGPGGEFGVAPQSRSTGLPS